MSFFADVQEFYEGLKFRNVEGSTDDPAISDMSWIELWKTWVRYAGRREPKCFGCSNCAEVGGHIVIGDGKNKEDAPVSAGALKGKARVFIVPLCKDCNGKSGKEVFTIRGQGVKAVRLCLFGENEKFNEVEFEKQYLRKHPKADLFSPKKLRNYRNLVESAELKYRRDMYKKKMRNFDMHSRDAYIIRESFLGHQKKWPQTMPIANNPPMPDASLTMIQQTNTIGLRNRDVERNISSTQD